MNVLWPLIKLSHVPMLTGRQVQNGRACCGSMWQLLETWTYSMMSQLYMRSWILPGQVRHLTYLQAYIHTCMFWTYMRHQLWHAPRILRSYCNQKIAPLKAMCLLACVLCITRWRRSDCVHLRRQLQVDTKLSACRATLHCVCVLLVAKVCRFLYVAWQQASYTKRTDALSSHSTQTWTECESGRV